MRYFVLVRVLLTDEGVWTELTELGEEQMAQWARQFPCDIVMAVEEVL